MSASPPPLAEGAVIRTVFPRMMGKERPGLVVHVAATREGPDTLVAVPMTTVRTNQRGRIAVAPQAGSGLDRACWLLLPNTAALPARQTLLVTGILPPDRLGEVQRALADWFGDRWRSTQPALTKSIAKPRLLHPVRRGPRR